MQCVTLGDDEARLRGTQKSVLERKAPPTFPLVIEMRERQTWVAHWVEDSVDALLTGKVPAVQLRRRDTETNKIQMSQYVHHRIDRSKKLEKFVNNFGNFSNDPRSPFEFLV